MSVLNEPAYVVERDRLIYDGTHPIDGGTVQVPLTTEEDGIIRRGSVIDFEAETGEYTLHKSGGTPNRIVAEDVEYLAADGAVVVSTYTAGTFRANEIIAIPELENADIESLRSAGIHLK